MIVSFADEDTRSLFHRQGSSKLTNIASVALRKLHQLDSITTLEQLRVPPGNRLEILRGNRLGQFSIRVNQKYRLCFRWQEGSVHDVELVDYH